MKLWAAVTACWIGCGAIPQTQNQDAAGTDSRVADAPADGAPDAPPDAAAPRHLYLTSDTSGSGGGIAQLTLPLTEGSTVNFTIPFPSAFGVTQDALGDLVVGDINGHIEEFDPPFSAESIPAFSFAYGTAGQLALDPAGDLFAGTQGATVDIYGGPLSAGTKKSSSASNANLDATFGTATDSAGNLYVSNVLSSANHESNVLMFAPPYTGTPVVGAVVTGVAYRSLPLTDTQLFVASVNGNGAIDVYDLPLTAGAAPAFEITSGLESPEACAIDADGNLYTTSFSGDVAVFKPPLSGSSVPEFTITTGVSSEFGAWIGP